MQAWERAASYHSNVCARRGRLGEGGDAGAAVDGADGDEQDPRQRVALLHLGVLHRHLPQSRVTSYYAENMVSYLNQISGWVGWAGGRLQAARGEQIERATARRHREEGGGRREGAWVANAGESVRARATRARAHAPIISLPLPLPPFPGGGEGGGGLRSPRKRGFPLEAAQAPPARPPRPPPASWRWWT